MFHEPWVSTAEILARPSHAVLAAKDEPEDEPGSECREDGAGWVLADVLFAVVLEGASLVACIPVSLLCFAAKLGCLRFRSGAEFTDLCFGRSAEIIGGSAGVCLAAIDGRRSWLGVWESIVRHGIDVVQVVKVVRLLEQIGACKRSFVIFTKLLWPLRLRIGLHGYCARKIIRAFERS